MIYSWFHEGEITQGISRKDLFLSLSSKRMDGWIEREGEKERERERERNREIEGGKKKRKKPAGPRQASRSLRLLCLPLIKPAREQLISHSVVAWVCLHVCPCHLMYSFLFDYVHTELSVKSPAVQMQEASVWVAVCVCVKKKKKKKKRKE